MSETKPRSNEDRILVRDGRRHHRRRYSRMEFRLGLGLLAALGILLAWVAWRGAHPDPALFSAPVDGDAGAGPGVAAVTADRGPLPADLVTPGWTETGAATFGPDNLYEKIDGREDFYKSFGFRRLWFISLQADDAAERAVDVEAYDLGEGANALGALSAEKPEGAAVEAGDAGLVVLDRNALYVARGPYYVRAIGSEESPPVRALLEHVRARLEAALPGEALPWAWALFVGRLGMDPGAISFTAENAFSFGFAKDVWSARRSDETELFVVATAGDAAATDLAGQFTAGFTEYGDAAGTSNGVSWAADRYLKTVSGAKSTGRWVIGVYGAPDLATAEAQLARISEAVRGLPLETAP